VWPTSQGFERSEGREPAVLWVQCVIMVSGVGKCIRFGAVAALVLARTADAVVSSDVLHPPAG